MEEKKKMEPAPTTGASKLDRATRLLTPALGTELTRSELWAFVCPRMRMSSLLRQNEE